MALRSLWGRPRQQPVLSLGQAQTAVSSVFGAGSDSNQFCLWGGAGPCSSQFCLLGRPMQQSVLYLEVAAQTAVSSVFGGSRPRQQSVLSLRRAQTAVTSVFGAGPDSSQFCIWR